jgi:hypothetical protein
MLIRDVLANARSAMGVHFAIWLCDAAFWPCNRVFRRLKPLIRKTQPYGKHIAHRGIWVEPSLLAEIEYRAKSAEGKVRHPVFKGIREDL